MRTKAQEDEDMVDRLNTMSSQSAIHVLQLHESSKLTEDQEKHNIHTMDLGDLNIDEFDNREKVATWVREMKPACIIGSSKGKSGDHISWCCSLYKLQVGEGRTFVHEHGLGSPDKRVREVGQSLEFGPSTVIPLLTLSSESTREAENAGVSSITVGAKLRHQRVRKVEEKSRVRAITN